MKAFLTTILLIFILNIVGASSYFVTTTGDDSNDGSVGNPWLTLSHASTNIVAGDTVNVAAGTYNETVTVRSNGTSESRITFIGTGLPTVNYFDVSGNYVTVYGFNLNGPGNAGSGDGSMDISGNYVIISGCTWTNTTWQRGINLQGVRSIITNCYWTSPTEEANNYLRTGFSTVGGNHLVTRNRFEHVADPEAFGLVWGTNITIEFNVMTNCTNPGYESPGTHADFLQTWAYDSTAWSSNVVVNGNSVVNCSAQCWMLNSANTGVSAVPTIRNWYIHNNVFANSGQSGSCYVPYVEIANNVFTNWGTWNGYAFIVRVGDGDPYGFGTNCTIYNNAFTDTTYARETAVTADYNQKNTSSLPSDGGTHNLYSLPSFVGELDFHLLSTSALTNAATTLSTFDSDADGVIRGALWDIGAYEYPNGPPETVATPAISPDGGNFTNTVSVTLTCSTAGSSIYYTTNGTTPTTNSYLYSSSFTLDHTRTVKAIGTKSGLTNSEIASALFSKYNATWYVRPGIFTGVIGAGGIPTPQTGIYDNQDGTSFDNAWNGQQSVVWGESGVKGGDTLYVCDTDIYSTTNGGNLGGQAIINVTNSRPSLPIVIRGDYPSHFGTNWGGIIGNYSKVGGAIYWTDLGNNYFMSTNLAYGVRFQKLSSGEIKMLVASTNVEGSCLFYPNGSSYTTNYIYPYPDSGGNWRTNLIQETSVGLHFYLKTNTHNIVFSNMVFNHSRIVGDFINNVAYVDQWQPSTNISFYNCEFNYNSYVGIEPYNDYWLFDGCKFYYNEVGVYVYGRSCPRAAHYLTVRNCVFTNSSPLEFQNGDGHHLGAQGLCNSIIESNRFYDAHGSCIEYWADSGYTTNNILHYNLIDTVSPKSWVGTSCGGIIFSTTAVPERSVGNYVYGNVIKNIASNSWGATAISIGANAPVTVTNNTIVNCYNGILMGAEVGGPVPVSGYVWNNILVNCTNKYFTEVNGTGNPTNLLVDYNLYYAVTGNISRTITHVFSYILDEHSITNDPAFRSISDFRLRTYSPAINAGRDGITDIGAYQYYSVPWYVRPLVKADSGASSGVGYNCFYVPKLGIYGTQDGTSYSNAFNGFKTAAISNVVQNGDTVYICGTHLPKMTNINYIGGVNVWLLANNLSNVIFRGDYPGDSGTVYGIFKGDWGEGSGPNLIYWHTNGSGVPYTTNFKYAVIAQARSDTEVRLLSRATDENNVPPGSRFFVNTGHTNFVMPYSDWPEMTNFYQESLGNSFRFNTNNTHITFDDITFFNSTTAQGTYYSEELTNSETPRYITFKNCEFYWDCFKYLIYPGCDNWSFYNNVFDDFSYGLYTIHNNAPYGPNGWIISGNVFRHSNRNFLHQDAHAIGMQSGNNWIVEYNYIYDIGGTAIEFFNSDYKPMTNCIIRYNYIEYTFAATNTITGCSAYALSGNNISSPSGTRIGFQIYGNVAYNIGNNEGTEPWSGSGFGSNSQDPVYVANNTFVRCKNNGIGLSSAIVPASGWIYNNILVDCTNRYLWYQGVGDPTNLYSDYNLFYDTVGGPIDIYKSPSFTGNDLNSVTNNPLFLGTTNFGLQLTSIAARNGTNQSSIFTTDKAHKEIIWWPMGAYSIQPSVVVTNSRIGTLRN